jgi:hypothetical protein
MVRSCYTVPMRFKDGDAPVMVRWFFVDRGAKYFPGLNSFYSRNWEDASEKFDEIGEQPGNRRWVNGQRPALALGQRLCDDPLLFRFGLAPGQTISRGVVAGPVPVCCLDPLGTGGGGEGFAYDGSTEWIGSGGAVADGEASWVRVVPDTQEWFGYGGGTGGGSETWTHFP